MKPPPRSDQQVTESLIQQAILEYLKAEDAGTTINPETWLQRFPHDIHPQLRDFLNRHITVSKPDKSGPQPPAMPPFDKYADFQLLAAGGMGSIYRCTDKQLRRPLAMKVMHPHLMGQRDLILRFYEEARTSARLYHHPAIAPVHEMGQTPSGQPFFTMKLIVGRTLAEAIIEYHKAPSREGLLTLLHQFEIVCDSVEYAHTCGVLHRDLKPANIMVGAFNEVLVMDWGLAKSITQPGTGVHRAVAANQTHGPALETEMGWQSEIGMIRGTLAYMPPEQADTSCPPLDEACDVFALGAILCQILTGQPPYVSTKADPRERQRDLLHQAQTGAVSGALARLAERKAPPPLLDLVRRCLDPRPQARPRRAKEVGQAVTAYLQSLQTAKRSQELQQAKQLGAAVEGRKRRRVQIVLGALLAGAVFLVLTGVMAYRWQHKEQVAKQSSDLETYLTDAEQALERNDLDTAQSKLDQASGRAKDGNASPELQARMDRVTQTIAFLHQLRRCWEDSRLYTPSGLNLPGAAKAYDVVFRDNGYHRDEPAAFKERARASHAQGAIADALDHWAVCAHEQAALRNQLLQLAEDVEPGSDGWETFRQPANWDNAKGVERIIEKADNALTGPRCALLALLLRMRNPECLDQLKNFEKRFPKEYEIALELGNLHLTRAIASKDPSNELHFALGSYNQAKVLHNGSAAVWCNKGLAEQRLGMHADAEDSFRKAIEVQPDNVICHNMLGYELYGTARWREALHAYEKAVALDKDNPSTCLLGAMLNWEIGDEKEAERLVRAVLPTMPEQPLVHFLLGAILMRQGRWDESVQELKEAKNKKSGDSMMGPLNLIGDFAIPYINTTLRDADKRYPAVMNGTAKPHATLHTDRYLLAEQMYLHDHPEAAAALFKEAFAARGVLDPEAFKRGSSVLYSVHYRTLAARAALQAAERATTAAKQQEYRKLALDWLTADLHECERLANPKADKDKGKRDFSQLLLHLLLGRMEPAVGENWHLLEPRRHVEGWQLYAEFQSVRDADKLAQLPADERKAWQEFWDRAAKLFAKK